MIGTTTLHRFSYPAPSESRQPTLAGGQHAGPYPEALLAFQVMFNALLHRLREVQHSARNQAAAYDLTLR